MTRDELLAKLREIADRRAVGFGEAEGDHYEADDALLDYIADNEIRKGFDAIEKWYA
jgi:hypothetical protein